VPARVEDDHAVTLRVAHPVREDRCARLPACHTLQQLGEPLRIEDVVAEDQAHPLAGDELLADQERLGQPSGRRLRREG